MFGKISLLDGLRKCSRPLLLYLFFFFFKDTCFLSARNCFCEHSCIMGIGVGQSMQICSMEWYTIYIYVSDKIQLKLMIILSNKCKSIIFSLKLFAVLFFLSFISVEFSRSVLSDSLRPHGLQHTRPPCSSPTPGVYSNSCPLSR